jgi:hypothetical protein
MNTHTFVHAIRRVVAHAAVVSFFGLAIGACGNAVSFLTASGSGNGSGLMACIPCVGVCCSDIGGGDQCCPGTDCDPDPANCTSPPPACDDCSGVCCDAAGSNCCADLACDSSCSNNNNTCNDCSCDPSLCSTPSCSCSDCCSAGTCGSDCCDSSC